MAEHTTAEYCPHPQPEDPQSSLTFPREHLQTKYKVYTLKSHTYSPVRSRLLQLCLKFRMKHTCLVNLAEVTDFSEVDKRVA